MTTIFAIWRLSRPINCVITALSVIVAAIITGPIQNLPAVVLASISAMLIAAAANTINDVYDLDIDRINKPQRPLPSGKISLRQARLAAISEYASGCLLALFISVPMTAMAILFSLLTWQYAARLKRQPLIGNLAVSLSTGAAFIYGALANGFLNEGIVPAAIAFLFHLAREIIKDLEDMEGDARGGAHTFPLRYGVTAAIRMTHTVFLLLVLVTTYPWLTGSYGNYYMLTVAVGVYPVLAYTAAMLQPANDSKRYNSLSNLLKADMIVGLLALLLQ